MQLNIDVTDWKEEFDELEPNVTGDDPIIDLRVNENRHPAQAARLLIIAREIEALAEDIMPANKLLLMTGASQHVSNYVTTKKDSVEINGKQQKVRRYVPDVKERDEDGEDDHTENDTQLPNVTSPSDSIVRYDDPKAPEYAEKYLFKQVTGLIWSRFKIIAANDGDLSGIADELKNQIDEMVMKLIE